MRMIVSCAFVALALTPSLTMAAPGSLDPTFGKSGIVNTSFGVDVRPSAAALQPNGDIVVAVTVGDNPTSAALVRYLPNGTLDASFGTGGIVTEMFQNQVNGTGGVIIQPDGKIVLEVTAGNTAGTVLESLLVRFNSNGTFDTSFGSGGQVVLTYPAPSPYSASPIVTLLEPNGDFLVLFSLTPPFRNHSPDLTALARYTSNGKLDSTFGTAGDSAAVSIGGIPSDMAVLTNGDTLVRVNPAIISEFSSTGTLLPSVTAGTVAVTSQGTAQFLANSDFLSLAAVQGSQIRRDIDSEVLRFLPNGTEDATFQPSIFDFAPVGAGVGSIAEAMAVAPNGQIAVSGEAVTAQNSSLGFGVARLNSNGSLDTTFGNGGIVITDFPSGGQALAVLVQPNGNIVAVGQVFPVGEISLGLVRYTAQ
jgi:uncharacterized delta-60 repeat protein